MIPIVGDKYSFDLSFGKTVNLVVEAVAIDNATKKQVFILHKIGCPGCFRKRLFLEEFLYHSKLKKL